MTSGHDMSEYLGTLGLAKSYFSKFFEFFFSIFFHRLTADSSWRIPAWSSTRRTRWHVTDFCQASSSSTSCHDSPLQGWPKGSSNRAHYWENIWCMFNTYSFHKRICIMIHILLCVHVSIRQHTSTDAVLSLNTRLHTSVYVGIRQRMCWHPSSVCVGIRQCMRWHPSAYGGERICSLHKRICDTHRVLSSPL